LEQLTNIPIETLTDGIGVESEFEIDKIKIKVKFKDGWKTGEKFSFGYHTINYTSSSNLIRVVGDATCGNATDNVCDFDDLYNADKSGQLELMANQTGANLMNLSYQIRPTDNATIPIVFNITGLTSSGTCNKSGSRSSLWHSL